MRGCYILFAAIRLVSNIGSTQSIAVIQLHHNLSACFRSIATDFLRVQCFRPSRVSCLTRLKKIGVSIVNLVLSISSKSSFSMPARSRKQLLAMPFHIPVLFVRFDKSIGPNFPIIILSWIMSRKSLYATANAKIRLRSSCGT